MRFIRTIALVALLNSALLIAPCHAEDPPLDCENALSTPDLNACASKDFEKADAELNRVYQAALKDIPEMAIADEPAFNKEAWEKALRASQRAWVAFRDAECNDHVPLFSGGGSMRTGEVIGCATEMTEARTKYLKDRYEIE